jgi:NAD(P)-dependent dehydrogenase (short-subunit alcohol dehydrogenase family)
VSSEIPVVPLRVLVTGAAGGIGKAISAKFASRGDKVLMTDVSQSRALPLPDGEVSFRHLDVRDEGNWQAAVTWCDEQWGGLDVLVNNAGVAAAGRVEKLASEDWKWILEINLEGVALGCKAVTPLFQRQGSGKIVNISSMAGLLNLPGMASYNVSKAAVIALSETLRHELAPDGVSTTVVCPGFTPTGLGETLRSPEPQLSDIAQRLISGGEVTPEQVADQVVAAAVRRKPPFLVLTHPRMRRVLRTRRLAPWFFDWQAARTWRKTLAKLEF